MKYNNKGITMNKTLKFAAVAVALGFISPTITINDKVATLAVSEVSFSIINMAEAREVKKKNRTKNKNKNKNTNRNTNVNSNKNTNTNVNRNTNKNTNVNVNTNKNTNVNVNVNNNTRRRVNPLGVVAAVVVGTVIVAAAMPPNCTTVIVNGNSYRQCGTTYYQTSGPDYIIVNSPY